MSKNLSDDFQDRSVENILEWIVDAAILSDWEALKNIINSQFVTPELLRDAMWSFGYEGLCEASELLTKFYKEKSFNYALWQAEINGQVMAAVDSGDIKEVQRLIKDRADIFQDYHSALYTSITKDDFEMFHFLLAEGLDPRIAFTDDDMEEFKQYKGSRLISEEGYGLLVQVRGKMTQVNEIANKVLARFQLNLNS